MPVDLYRGDCLETLRRMPDNFVDSIVTDPPYGLSKAPDIADVLTHWMAGDDYTHQGGGFMGKTWDSFVPGPAVWKECLRVLKPGGYLLAFAGTRTVDLMGIAIRLGGFEIRDELVWLYGSGFPKSMDVSKAMDKAAGGRPDTSEEARAARYADAKPPEELTVGDLDPYNGLTITGIKPGHEDFVSRDNLAGLRDGEAVGDAEGGFRRPWMDDPYAVVSQHLTHANVSEEADQWKGWGTALKPAHEPIVMARKPFVGTVANNVLAHGTGAINVDASRVGSDGGGTVCSNRDAEGSCLGHNNAGRSTSGETFHAAEVVGQIGRFPANVMLSHDGGCVQEGTKTIKGHKGYPKGPGGKSHHYSSDKRSAEVRPNAWVGHPDQEVEAWECVEDCPVRMLDEQSGVSKSTVGQTRGGGRASGIMGKHVERSDKDVPFGYSDKGGASRFFYCAKSAKKERNAGLPEGMENKHPTVKPVALMQYLVTLVTPPDGAVLDPFVGSGTTMVAATQAGFDGIGLDLDDIYLDTAEHRVVHVGGVVSRG